mgnify:CR=1 FL=1
MAINQKWSRWVKASCAKHFKDLRQGENFHVEGEDRQSDGWSAWLEFRIDGPKIRPQPGNMFRLDVEINIACVQVENNNAYSMEDLVGVVVTSFTNQIGLYKFGPSGDVENDRSHFGCLTLDTMRDKDGIIVSNFGKIRPDTEMLQTTVEGHYFTELEGV